MNPQAHNYTAPPRNACEQFAFAVSQNHSTLIQIWFPPKPRRRQTVLHLIVPNDIRIQT